MNRLYEFVLGGILRAIISLVEKIEAVDWYNQRIDMCRDEQLKAILID
jgi:hypothetical protein